jgi:hypothetical protein
MCGWIRSSSRRIAEAVADTLKAVQPDVGVEVDQRLDAVKTELAPTRHRRSSHMLWLILFAIDGRDGSVNRRHDAIISETMHGDRLQPSKPGEQQRSYSEALHFALIKRDLRAVEPARVIRATAVSVLGYSCG